MADYYTKFSLLMTLPDAAAVEQAVALARQASRIKSADESPENFPTALLEVVEDWQFETEPQSHQGKPGLWLHSGNDGIEAACAFIQHLLRTFNPGGRQTFEWSNDCSKPRVDAFGGGAAIVTAQEIKLMTTTEWLAQQTAIAEL